MPIYRTSSKSSAELASCSNLATLEVSMETMETCIVYMLVLI